MSALFELQKQEASDSSTDQFPLAKNVLCVRNQLDQQHNETVLYLHCRLEEELQSQHEVNTQLRQQAGAALSALDELQARKEVSDSGRGRLRGILSAAVAIPSLAKSHVAVPVINSSVPEELVRVPSIHQSSR